MILSYYHDMMRNFKYYFLYQNIYYLCIMNTQDTYIFVKSGSEVRIVSYDKKHCTVKRIDTGKHMLVPSSSLKTKNQLCITY